LHRPADDRGDLVADLRREFYCAQTLSHENIVNVYQLDRDGDIDFFTMELLEGELLSSVLGRLHPAPMSQPQAWAIIRDIGSGLAHAHSRNVIHADLKPQNIMVTHAGEVRILDFSNAVGLHGEISCRRGRYPMPAAKSWRGGLPIRATTFMPWRACPTNCLQASIPFSAGRRPRRAPSE
jgi:serine/threonine protein kinase